MNRDKKRAVIVGAGYICEYHIAAIKQTSTHYLCGICDIKAGAAARIAESLDDVTPYLDLAQMIQQEKPDVVHVLTPPDSHFALAKLALEQGCNVVIEKPFVTNSEEAKQLLNVAYSNGVKIAVNHNFTRSVPFIKLKEIIKSKTLGPIKSIVIEWKKPLDQATHGPWDLWMLRDPRNIFLETGAHSFAELLTILEDPKVSRVEVRKKRPLPSGVDFLQQWNVAGSAGSSTFEINCAHDPGYEQHSVKVEGLFGVAIADIENDVFDLQQNTGYAYDMERLRINLKRGLLRIGQAVKTFAKYGISKFNPKHIGGPYEVSMGQGVMACYAVFEQDSERSEFSGVFAHKVMEFTEQVWRKLSETLKTSPDQIYSELPVRFFEGKQKSVLGEVDRSPEYLLTGASGFIGKQLLKAMQERGFSVRAMVRNPSSLVDVKFNQNSEIFVGDFREQSVVQQALQGVSTVIHLAQSHSNSLAGYLKNNHDPTQQLVNACKQLEIKRFIYAGTIDSLDLSEKRSFISELSGVDAKIERRNNYARSKATTEFALQEHYKFDNFPVVILRPAIVLGRGGPLAHLGIAQWHGLGRCTYWGRGSNPLPLVLCEDIVSAFLGALTAPGIEGRVYNLAAPSKISAADYVQQVEQALGCRITTSTSSATVSWFLDSSKWVLKLLANHPDKNRRPSLHDWLCREQHAQFDCSAAAKDLDWVPESERSVIVEKGIFRPALDYIQS